MLLTENRERQDDLERTFVEAMFQTRPHDDLSSWNSGSELEDEAHAYFDKHGDEVMAVIHEVPAADCRPAR